MLKPVHVDLLSTIEPALDTGKTLPFMLPLVDFSSMLDASLASFTDHLKPHHSNKHDVDPQPGGLVPSMLLLLSAQPGSAQSTDTIQLSLAESATATTQVMKLPIGLAQGDPPDISLENPRPPSDLSTNFAGHRQDLPLDFNATPISDTAPKILAELVPTETKLAWSDISLLDHELIQKFDAAPLKNKAQTQQLPEQVSAYLSTAPAPLEYIANPLSINPSVGPKTDAYLSNQLVETIHWQVAHGEEKATLRLDPPALGKVEIHLWVSDNQTSVSFMASTPTGREAILAALPRLQESLQLSGLPIAQFSVSAELNNSGKFNEPPPGETRKNRTRQIDASQGNPALISRIETPLSRLVDTFI